MKLILLFIFASLSAPAQTALNALTNGPVASSNSLPKAVRIQPGQNSSFVQQVEEIRMDCINSRRYICGKILKILPGGGLVVDSGYTDLLREPLLSKSWLVPGIVSATRVTNVIEGKEPGSICFGLILLTDLPRNRGLNPEKPKLYDYVIIQAFPEGQYTYTSVGSVQRTIRRFSANLSTAVQWRVNSIENQAMPSKPNAG
jgi:hypothetical protein